MKAVRERPVELDVELLELAGEVAVELLAHVGERGVVLRDPDVQPLPEVVGQALGRLARERQAQQPLRPARECQEADRRVDGSHREHARRVDDHPARGLETHEGGASSPRPALGCFGARPS